MEVVAVSKKVTISPRKLRLIADSIRKLSLEEAQVALSILKKRGSLLILKTLKSAISNAINNANLKRENLIIKNIEIMEGGAFKRGRASTRGRLHPFKKRMSHIKIILTDDQIQNPKIRSQNSKNFEKEEPAEKPKS